MNIALAQCNFTVGDLEGNFQIIKNEYEKTQKQADLLVFSELSLIGYPPNDLLLRKGFVERQLNYLSKVRELTEEKKCPIVVGAATINNGKGKPLHNSLIMFYNGREVLRYHKQLLPTYNIFDENRYFEPGSNSQNNVMDFYDLFWHRKEAKTYSKVGFLICEDAWNDEACTERQVYPTNPLENILEHDLDFLVTINASPSDHGKQIQRYNMYSRLARKYNVIIGYVNQIGGNDELIFDGSSFFVTPEDKFNFNYAFTNSNLFFGQNKGLCAQFFNKDEYIWKQLKLGLKDYLRKTGFKKIVLGLSGGVDSALVTALACEVVGAQNVFAITLPSKFSSEGSVSHSNLMQKVLGFHLYEIPINEVVKTVEKEFETSVGKKISGVANENIQARIRAVFVMAYSNQFNALVLATGNKSEISVGYCTLYGDAIGGLSVIGDCYKTEVFSLCNYVNAINDSEIIPNAIINKPPSAELKPDQIDTNSLPEYEVLDAILKLYLENEFINDEDRDCLKNKISKLTMEEIESILRKVDCNEFKRKQFPPILRVHQRSFGFGRNLPLAQKFKTDINSIL